MELDPQATCFGYVALQLEVSEREQVLEQLHRRGWLYLYDGRGLGPLPPPPCRTISPAPRTTPTAA